ncbi:MAG: ABC transporter ATP-binding protein [Actinomycetia bacterium]|nr:ABC transporter ATP-binding protein [Actinomycetes bacterium]
MQTPGHVRQTRRAGPGANPVTTSGGGDDILVIEHLNKRFGGLQAVDDASLTVERGTLTALIGPNGAGKTTLFNLITGFDRPDRGRVVFDGHVITARGAPAIARLGLVRTFQLARDLARLTVLENMLLAAKDQRGELLRYAALPFRPWRQQEAQRLERAAELLEAFNLDHLRDEYAGNLSGGQRKLLDLARVLMLEPTMVLLDEPMAGVNPTLREQLLARIAELRDRGLSFLLVEHDMEVVMRVSEHVIVMAEGSVIADGSPDEIRANQQVIDAYLGTKASS